MFFFLIFLEPCFFVCFFGKSCYEICKYSSAHHTSLFTINFLLNLITLLFKYDTICLKVCCTCTIKQIYGLQLDLEMQSRDALCVLVKELELKFVLKSVDL